MKQIYDKDGKITKEGKVVYQEIGKTIDSIYRTFHDVSLRDLQNIVNDSNHDSLLNFLLLLESR
jgi:hypothetical protein